MNGIKPIKENKNQTDTDDSNAREDLNTQDSFEGLVSYYENQNILDNYFDNNEAQELRDLGVCLIDAKDVSSTIFEQVKTHFRCTGNVNNYENKGNDSENDKKLSDNIKTEINEIVELETREDEFDNYELKDDSDLDNYNNRIKISSVNYGLDKNKIILISNESYSTKLYIWEKIWNALYLHQKEGVLWMWDLYCNNHGGILADEMGLGKSVTVAAFIAAIYITLNKNNMNYIDNNKNYVKSEIKDEIINGDLCKNEYDEPFFKSSSFFSPFVSDNKCKSILLVLPATLISHWIEVFNRWYYPLRIILFHGKGDNEKKQILIKLNEMENCCSELLVITTYETLRRNLFSFKQINWFYIILDEGHKIRNPDSGITLAVKSIATCNRILLSGSPIQNDLKELWSLIDFVYPGRLGTLPIFEQQFVLPIKQAELRNSMKVEKIRGISCTKILQELIKSCILRRRKHELQNILNLPSQAEHVLFCTLTSIQYDVYCNCLDLLQANQLIKNKMNSLSRYFALLNILREVCNHPELLRLIRKNNKKNQFSDEYDEENNEYNFYDNSNSEYVNGNDLFPSDSNGLINVNGKDSGKYQALLSILKLWKTKNQHRVLIFTQGVRTLKLISNLLEKDMNLKINKDILTLDGSTPLNIRFSLVKRFNQDPSIFIFILTSRVGGVGLNIIGANRVILYDPWWNPMTDMQAKERCWRIGQKKEVIVYRLITKSTIEEKIFQRQLFKEFIAKQILKDPKNHCNMNWNNFNELLNKPKRPSNYTPDKNSVLNYIKNIKNIWGHKTNHRKDGNTYSSYFDKHDHETYDNQKEYINNELNLFGEITCDAKSEHNAIMNILGDNSDNNLISNNIGSSNLNNDNYNDKYQSLYSDINEATNEILRTSLEMIKQSEIERSNYNCDIPTWTGRSGQAGAPSSFILQNLKRQKLSQNRDKDFEDIQQIKWDENSIRKRLIEYFIKREKLGITTSTENLLNSFGDIIPDSNHNLFKKILKQICTLKKSINNSSGENIWILRKNIVI